MTQLCAAIADPRLVALLERYVRRTVYQDGLYRDVTQGISLGCPLSPLIAALYLKPLDERLEATGLFLRSLHGRLGGAGPDALEVAQGRAADAADAGRAEGANPPGQGVSGSRVGFRSRLVTQSRTPVFSALSARRPSSHGRRKVGVWDSPSARRAPMAAPHTAGIRSGGPGLRWPELRRNSVWCPRNSGP